MYLSVGNYAKIEKALKECTPSGEEYNSLPEDKKRILLEADKAMLDTYRQYLKDNSRANGNTKKYRERRKGR